MLEMITPRGFRARLPPMSVTERPRGLPAACFYETLILSFITKVSTPSLYANFIAL